VGCYKDPLSHLWVMQCWRPQQRNNDAWREVQEIVNTSRYSKKYTASFLLQKSTFRQKCFQKQMCSTPQIQYTCKMKIIKWNTLEDCNLWIWQSDGLHVCYKWMTVKFNEHFCIPLAPLNLSCILHCWTFCGFQLQNCVQKWIQKLQQVTHMLSVKRNSVAPLRN
jgi:hypothetical protein